MDTRPVVVSFHLTDKSLRSQFADFLAKHLERDLPQTYFGEVDDDQLEAIKRKASNVKYEDEHASDGIVIYVRSSLGMDKKRY